MDGSAVKVIVNYAPDITGPRDRAHRRVAEQTNKQFSLLDQDIDTLKAALEALGEVWNCPAGGDNGSYYFGLDGDSNWIRCLGDAKRQQGSA